jgi:hypothetical protein
MLPSPSFLPHVALHTLAQHWFDGIADTHAKKGPPLAPILVGVRLIHAAQIPVNALLGHRDSPFTASWLVGPCAPNNQPSHVARSIPPRRRSIPVPAFAPRLSSPGLSHVQSLVSKR